MNTYYSIFSIFFRLRLKLRSLLFSLLFFLLLGFSFLNAQVTCTTTVFPDSWGLKQLEASSLPYRSVYTFPEHDLDGDGLKDIVTGGWWYKNPGSVAGTWVRSSIGNTFNNVALVHDFDGDGDMDLLGTTGAYTGSDLVWAQNNGSGVFTVFSNIPSGNTNYSEPFLAGIAGGIFQVGGPYQMAINWNGAESTGSPMQMLTPTTNPTTGTWSLVDIPNAISTGEDLQAGDIDQDNDLDLFQGVNWIRNNGASGWQTIPTGINYVTTPDRAQLADFDRDGDLDAVVGQLGVGAGTNPDSYRFSWFESPSDPTQAWIEHVLDTDVRGSLSVTASDIDFDGDQDIVVGEWLGQHRLLVFENKLCVDGTFSKRTLNSGDPSKEHHDGARVTDIDNDGDLDVVSNGWQNNFPRIYENQSIPVMNEEPLVNAGSDQNVSTAMATLNGSASDPDGGNITALLWSQTSGPNTASLAGATTQTLTASNLVDGTYVFALTATDDENDTNFDEVIIVVAIEEEPNEAPVAIAEANIITGNAPLPIVFTGSNSTDDIAVVSYSWDFGDGTSSIEADPTKTFTIAGVYSVQLSVADGSGLTNSTTLTITITVEENENQMPVAVIEADVLSGFAALEVNFTGANSTNDIATYLWDFGDGTSSTEPNPTKEFQEPGEYTVQLTVTNQDGLTNSKSIVISVLSSTSEMQIILEKNPVSQTDAGMATIRITNMQDNIWLKGITIHDVGGRYISGHSPIKNTETDFFELPVSFLRDGLYFVKVKLNTDKSTLLKLLVKN